MVSCWVVVLLSAFVAGTHGVRFLPEAPSTANSKGSCTTPINGHKGQCIPRKDCTGATFNDLCAGDTYVCCVTETTPVDSVIEHISFKTFNDAATGISDTRAAALWPYFNKAIDSMLTDNPNPRVKCQRIAALFAQIGHESMGLLYFEEIASGSAYEGRCTGLGNCQYGDGKRYKGRGPIQLTGRYNYNQAKNSLNVDYIAKPELVCFPSHGFTTSMFYWNNNNLNRYCTGKLSDFDLLSIAINGGRNGLIERRVRWNELNSAMQCDLVSTTPVPTPPPPPRPTPTPTPTPRVIMAQSCASGINPGHKGHCMPDAIPCQSPFNVELATNECGAYNRCCAEPYITPTPTDNLVYNYNTHTWEKRPLYRDDARCGAYGLLANGQPAQCEPGNCCSAFGWCGNTSTHCCAGCARY